MDPKPEAEDNGTKKTEENNTELKCASCAKTFTKQADLDTHIKVKHEKQ